MSVSGRRSFWTGIGSGLVIGAVLLQVMNIAVQRDMPPIDSEMQQTEAEPDWRKLAEEAGYALYPSDVKLYTQEELDEQLRLAQAAAEQDGAASGEAVVTDVDAENGNAANVDVQIKAGMLASDVAELLSEAGIVADKDAFESRLKEQKRTPKIRSGVYSFAPGEDMDSVIEKITFD
ncbi:endolytic transglycosylase MltG [Paenibacillus sp. 32O-W]|uniref:endolytic transglycosylase MltG n=1 Tax=Paenibacillus sp. 32O-W TaxID=1695218 RepID=UPI0011A17DC5|nr:MULTISPECIES: endolytic transglycosylase MltG [Paenibacillaceae]